MSTLSFLAPGVSFSGPLVWISGDGLPGGDGVRVCGGCSSVLPERFELTLKMFRSFMSLRFDLPVSLLSNDTADGLGPKALDLDGSGGVGDRWL